MTPKLKITFILAMFCIQSPLEPYRATPSSLSISLDEQRDLDLVEMSLRGSSVLRPHWPATLPSEDVGRRVYALGSALLPKTETFILLACCCLSTTRENDHRYSLLLSVLPPFTVYLGNI